MAVDLVRRSPVVVFGAVPVTAETHNLVVQFPAPNRILHEMHVRSTPKQHVLATCDIGKPVEGQGASVGNVAGHNKFGFTDASFSDHRLQAVGAHDEIGAVAGTAFGVDRRATAIG